MDNIAVLFDYEHRQGSDIYEVGPTGKVLVMRWTVGGSQKGLNQSCHAVSISGTNPTQNLGKKRKKKKESSIYIAKKFSLFPTEVSLVDKNRTLR